MKININYNKDPFFIHRSIIDIIESIIPKNDDGVKPYFNYFLMNSIVACELKMDFNFSFELLLYGLRNSSEIQNIQAKHNTPNSCYQNYFKENLGNLMLKILKLYETELRECSSVDVLKEAAKSTN